LCVVIALDEAMTQEVGILAVFGSMFGLFASAALGRERHERQQHDRKSKGHCDRALIKRYWNSSPSKYCFTPTRSSRPCARTSSISPKIPEAP
jgi:hypothetical protein